MEPSTLIAAFAVPPASDAAFLAGWARTRAGLAATGGVAATTLHRALRADVALRFVCVARVESQAAGRAAIAELPPFASHASLYEVVHEDGTPEGPGGAVLVDPFEVPEDADDAFVGGWGRTRDLLAAQRGHLGTRLHRSLAPADFRFVEIARWSSPLMFARALQRPDVQAAAAAMPFPSHPALHLVVGD